MVESGRSRRVSEPCWIVFGRWFSWIYPPINSENVDRTGRMGRETTGWADGEWHVTRPARVNDMHPHRGVILTAHRTTSVRASAA